MQIKVTAPATMLRDGSMFIYGQIEQPAMKAEGLPQVLGQQLSQIRRYCGMIRRPISVAAHSLLALQVARIMPHCQPTGRILTLRRDIDVLLHDAGEIATGDQPGPFLRYWLATDRSSYDAIYNATKVFFDDAVYHLLDLPPCSVADQHPVVIADYQALLLETRAAAPTSEHYSFKKPAYWADDVEVDEYFAMTADGSDAAIFTQTLETLLAEYRAALAHRDGLPAPLPATKERAVEPSEDHQAFCKLIDDAIVARREWAASDEGRATLGPGSPTIPGMQDLHFIRDWLNNRASPKVRANYIPMENMYLLHTAAAELERAYAAHDNFGCYLVGSCVERPDFRDVDVRCIMHDDAFEALFPKDPETGLRPLWMLTCMSLSQWFKHVTKLPVDFQFQKQSVANARHKGRRDGLGTYFFKGDAT